MIAVVGIVLAAFAAAACLFGYGACKLASEADNRDIDPPIDTAALRAANESARLHDRFTDCLDVAIEAFKCYEGECAWSVQNAEDEFDREAFARQKYQATAAIKLARLVRDRKPGTVSA